MSPRMAAILATGVSPAIVHMSAYANTLTRLIPDLYAGLDVVSRELVGFIPSVRRNSTAERASVGEAVVWHIAPSQTSVDIVPAMVPPEPRDQTIGNNTLTITKAKKVEFGFTGEEQKGLNNGSGYLSLTADMFAQSLRTLVNEMEVDLGVEAAAHASRATGTAGTTPFATGVGDTAQLRKIMDDNGAPATGRSVIIDTTAGANLRTNTQLTKANEAGNIMTLRQGELVDLHGFSLKESAGIQRHTKGTAASATTTAAAFAVGATVIALASAGTGTIVAGDTVTFAGDTNKYQVVTGDADTSNGGSITIAAPGLRQAIPASATAITVGGTYTANIGFTQNALVLACRAPALPQEGDAALDSMMLTDPRSGLTFEVRIYAGYRKILAEVAMAWGVKATKDEHIAMLLG